MLKWKTIIPVNTTIILPLYIQEMLMSIKILRFCPPSNSKYTSASLYIRISNKILEVQDQLLSSGYSVAEIYDKVLQEWGGPLNSQSQSSEPRDKSQMYRWKSKERKECTENNQKVDDLQLLINNLNEINLIQSIVIKKDSYFLFWLQIAK